MESHKPVSSNIEYLLLEDSVQDLLSRLPERQIPATVPLLPNQSPLAIFPDVHLFDASRAGPSGGTEQPKDRRIWKGRSWRRSARGISFSTILAPEAEGHTTLKSVCPIPANGEPCSSQIRSSGSQSAESNAELIAEQMALLASISSAPPPAPPYVPDGEIVLNENGVVAF
ncbi:hypothetical protein MMC22_007795 [Lobaria immixta]|nr:hypothetical protein [Lobaria immixta]